MTTVSAATVRRLGAALDDTCLQISASIKAGTLSDSFDLVFTTEQDIDYRYISTILDWDFSVVASSVSQSRRTANRRERWTVTGASDVEDVLHKAISFPTTGLTGAHEIMTYVAAQLGKTLQWYCTDFNIRAVSDTPTVRDIVSRLFNWSKSIPTMTVNVFIRGANLWVVQRGQEPSSYTLAVDTNGNPAIHTEKLYTLASGTDSAGNDKKGAIPLDWETGTEFLSGTYSGEGSSVVVDSGLTITETSSTANETTTTSKTYTRNATSAFLVSSTTEITGTGYSKVITMSRTYDNTSASYGYMVSESYDIAETKNGTTTHHTRTVYYQPDGMNAYSVSEYEDGKFVKGQTCVGRPPSGAESYLTANDSRTPRPEKETTGETLNEYNLPMTDTEVIDAIVAEIERIHGKKLKTYELSAEETHLLDLNQSIVYDGNTYYLESNRALKLPAKTTQAISMVRVV